MPLELLERAGEQADKLDTEDEDEDEVDEEARVSMLRMLSRAKENAAQRMGRYAR